MFHKIMLFLGLSKYYCKHQSFGCLTFGVSIFIPADKYSELQIFHYYHCKCGEVMSETLKASESTFTVSPTYLERLRKEVTEGKLS